MKPPKFAIHKRAAKRVESGHPWVFANELKVPAKELPYGGVVDVTSPEGRFIGRGYANGQALIAVRVCTRDKTQHLDLPGFWAARIRESVALRGAMLPGAESIRLVNGEADGMPGLVIDRFGSIASVHVETVGIESRLEVIKQALLDAVPGLTGAVLRNDDRARSLDGLPRGRSVWFGDVPEHVQIQEGDVQYSVSPLGGQFTGHELMQRRNRETFARLMAGEDVLDLFAGTGGFGLHALRGGASSVTFVEKNQEACVAIERNLSLNEFTGQVGKDDARKFLMTLLGTGDRFGGVVLDPPAFAKSRKEAGSALKGYMEINALAMQVLSPGGFLFTQTRSPPVLEDRYLSALDEAATMTGKRLKLVQRGDLSPDHPGLAALPDLRPLKSYLFQVLPAV